MRSRLHIWSRVAIQPLFGQISWLGKMFRTFFGPTFGYISVFFKDSINLKRFIHTFFPFSFIGHTFLSDIDKLTLVTLWELVNIRQFTHM